LLVNVVNVNVVNSKVIWHNNNWLKKISYRYLIWNKNQDL